MELSIIIWKIRELTLPVILFAPKSFKEDIFWFLVHLNFGFQPLVFYMSPATTEFQDHSGFASLEELDPLAADHLAKQPWRKEQTQRKQQNWGISGNFLPNQQGPTSLMMSFFKNCFFRPFLLGRNDLVWRKFLERGVSNAKAKKNMSPAWLGLTTWRCLPLWRSWCLVGLKVMRYFQHLFCNDVWGTFIPNPDENNPDDRVKPATYNHLLTNLK